MIFESEYDWSQFLQGLIVSIALVFSGGNIVATLLSFYIFFLGCYYAFGQKIIFFDSYICSQCTKKVGVILDVKTVLKTEPIQEDPLRNPQIIKDVEEALKDPRHNDRI